jgi:hypothetical protein
MATITLNLELHSNNRVTNGLYEVEHLWACDEGFAIYPRGGFRDGILAAIDVDAGRYDSEGDAYIVSLLQILPGDLISSEVAE